MDAIDFSKIPNHTKRIKKYASFKVLQDGKKLRYYDKLRPAAKSGRAIGARSVTEVDVKTGQTRSWMETLDSQNRPTIIHPKYADKSHYVMNPETGKFTGETF